MSIVLRRAAAAAICALLLCLTTPTNSTQADIPGSAKKIANLLENHYRHAQTLRAIFLERYSEGPRDAHIESGTVYFQRPGRMRWEYESPEQKLFLADGKTVWFYVPADRTVTRGPVKESADWRTPLALLTGQANLMKLCSKIELADHAPGLPPSHAVLRCLPKVEPRSHGSAGKFGPEDSTELPGAGEFTEVLIELDSSSGELARVTIRQPGGIELGYQFGDWRENLPLPEDLFRFQPPAGVAIVNGGASRETSRIE
jgi:outer membrane lipoprotein carrier protein